MKNKEFLTQELNRYKKQLEALESDDSYNDFEDKRANLRDFYKSKIRELEATLKKPILKP